MTETAAILCESVDRLLAQSLVEERGRQAWDSVLWDALAAQGILDALAATLDEDTADPGRLGIDGAINILFIAGRHAAPVPLAEHMVAAWLAAIANVELPDGPVTLAGAGWHDEVVIDAQKGTIKGMAMQVAFAREARAVMVCGETSLAIVPVSEIAVSAWENTAGEARDRLDFGGIQARVEPLPVSRLVLQACMAGARAIQIAGALDRVLELTAKYVQERNQFGRPIAKFQAVQQSLAEMGGQVATTRAAVGLAAAAFGSDDGIATLAAAKIRAGEAVAIASRIAHQAHGAIGFTREYDLQRFTRRLWSWRDDYGNESQWARWLGLALTQEGANGEPPALWPLLTEGPGLKTAREMR